MATDSPAFDRACEELQQQTDLDRLEVRGTIRIGLKTAGLDAVSVDPDQMCVMLRRVLPAELSARGVSDPDAICETVATAIVSMEFDRPNDRVSAAAATISRFGS
jgi:hypothetical protein